jgi:hypothetical protein
VKFLKWTGLGALSCALLLLSTASAKALMIAPSPIALRVAQADVVVVGKVLKLEDNAEMAPRFPGDKEKAAYAVAVVQISDPLSGAKGMKEIRVGFIPPAANPVPPRPPIRRYPQVDLKPGEEVCLFLSRHAGATFYTPRAYFDAIKKEGNANFDKEVGEARRCGKLLANPEAGLKAREAEDRLLTAAMLVNRYRIQRTPEAKQEPIDAEQSRLILKALADADWNAPVGGPVIGPGFRLTAQQVFFQLGLTPADGWTPPKDARQIPEEARRWLQANATTYRIKRFVNEPEK